MPELKFDGKVIPVTHLLPDDVLVFRTTERASAELRIYWMKRLREQFPLPRELNILEPGVDLEIHRFGKLIPVGDP